VVDNERNVSGWHHEVERAGWRLAGHDDESWKDHNAGGLASLLHTGLSVIGWAGHHGLDRSAYMLPGPSYAPKWSPLRVPAG
jgi:hypothetical protein